MKTILISPYSSKLENNHQNPKNYPFWQEVINNLKSRDIKVIQCGVDGEDLFKNIDGHLFNLSFIELGEEVKKCNTWISVDSYFQHVGAYFKKTGIVLWGKSDPEIFGYKSNINLLKDKKYLRKGQFDLWTMETFDKNCFVEPQVVIKIAMELIKTQQ